MTKIFNLQSLGTTLVAGALQIKQHVPGVLSILYKTYYFQVVTPQGIKPILPIHGGLNQYCLAYSWAERGSLDDISERSPSKDTNSIHRRE